MGVLIRTGDSTPSKYARRIEFMLQRVGARKAEERPRHAVQIAGVTDKQNLGFCPTQHSTMAWAGPPHAPLPRRWVCLDCREVATEDEIRDMGETFDTCTDLTMFKIMDARLRERAKHPGGKFLFFARR